MDIIEAFRISFPMKAELSLPSFASRVSLREHEVRFTRFARSSGLNIGVGISFRIKNRATGILDLTYYPWKDLLHNNITDFQIGSEIRDILLFKSEVCKKAALRRT